MYERMLDKSTPPSEGDISEYLGVSALVLMQEFEQELKKRYDLKSELTFPFGNHYGWCYKYSHRSKHLCHLFFEKEAFTILLQISGKDKDRLEGILDTCQHKTRELWNNRYPCGEGGWLRYRVFTPLDLIDILRMIEIKKTPINAS